MKRRNQKRLRFESMEARRLLAVDVPDAISGNVYVDADANGVLSEADTRIEDVRVELLRRTTEMVDGEPVNMDTVVAETTTNADGFYCFGDLDVNATYVVRQPEQVVDSRELSEVVGQPFSVMLQNIDRFESNQIATEFTTINVGSRPFTSFVTDADEVLGSERDMFATAIEGDVSLTADGGRLSFNSQDGSIGDFLVQWDGTDGDAGNGLGLGGVDLSGGFETAGIYLRGAAELPNIGVAVRLYSGGRVISSIRQALPVLEAAPLFWSFAEAFQDPTDGTEIDAIELLIQPDPTSSPGWVTDLSVIAPRIQNIGNSLTADLQITKTDNRATAVPGTEIQYLITARNDGPDAITGATVSDVFGEQFIAVQFDSEANNGATGNTISGEGNIADTLDLPVGSSVTYVVNATLAPEATGEVVNVATIAAPDNFNDPDESNNSASDTNELEPEFTINITGVDEVESVLPGDTVNYEFTITNEGPSVARRVRVTSDVSPLLENITFTSESNSGVSGNTESGNDGFEDELTLTPGSSITYRINGDVIGDSFGTVVTSVAAATLLATDDGDIVVEEQIATDSNVIQLSGDLSITQTNDVEILVPGENAVYTIVVRNNGLREVENVLVESIFAAELTEVSYTSEVTAGIATGNTAEGSGNIEDTVTMSVGAEITYTASTLVAPRATGVVTNVATVTGPEDLLEETPDDNTAAETDDVQPLGELSIESRVVTELVVPGMPITYEIVVSKTGPSSADGAIVTALFDDAITGITYTSESTGGAVGNSSGQGTINDTLQLPDESEVIYTVTGLLSADATGDVESSAMVVPPDGFVDGNPDDNATQTSVTPSMSHDIVVTQSTPTEFATFGGEAEYLIVVRNDGPSRARGVSVMDAFPATLTNVRFTSTATNGATGSSDGSGSIAQTLDLPVGSTVTYAVTAEIRNLGDTLLTNVFTASATNDPSPESNSASASIEVSTGLVTRQVVVGDLNGDSFEDAVVVHEYSGERNDQQGTLAILINDGSGGLQLRERIRVGDRPQSVAIGDFDKDGSNDLVVARVGYAADSAANSLLVLMNNGSGRFSQRSTVKADDGPIFVTTGDLDNDGDTDIAVANFRSNTVSVVRSHGNGTFAPAINMVAGEQPISVAIGNFNADSRQDIAVANYGSGTVAVYSGPFRPARRPSANLTAARSPAFVLATDLDQDGNDDIAVADYETDSAFVYYGRGNGTFVPPTGSSRLRLPGGSQPQSLVASDFNADGSTDIAVAQSSSDGVSIFFGQGERSFTAGQNVDVKAGPESVAAIARTLLATSLAQPGRANLHAQDDDGVFQPVRAIIDASSDASMEEVSDSPAANSAEASGEPPVVVDQVNATRRQAGFFAISDDALKTDVVDNLFDVMANDWLVDPVTSELTVRSTAGTRGAVSVIDGMIRYQSANGFVGRDAFVYEVRDSLGNVGSARVAVDVAAPAERRASTAVPVSKPPVTRAFAFMVMDDRVQVESSKSSVEINVLANDRTNAKRVWIENQSGPGSAYVSDDGRMIFTVGDGQPGDRMIVLYSVEDAMGAVGSARVEFVLTSI